MSNIKLVLTDLDGTLVRAESDNATDEVIAAMHAARQQGIKFAAVSGRPSWMAKSLLQTIGFDDPCILEGGALIISPKTEEVLWSKTLPVETAKEAVAQLMQHATIIEYGYGLRQVREVNLEEITKPVFSVWASVPVDIAAGLVTRVATLPEVAVHANAGPGDDFSRVGIQVTHMYADKAHAVKALLAILNITKAHTLAIGDGDNDIPLLQAAAVKIAMGNASDKLKAIADFIVPDVAHDGFVAAIKTYAL